MRTVCFVCVFLALVSFGAARSEYTIDFTESFSMDAFSRANVPLEIPLSVVQDRDPGRRWLPEKARYVFKLPSSNTLTFEANRGHIVLAHKDPANAGRLVLYGNASEYYLSAEEAYTVLGEFHESFGISSANLDTWFEPIRNGELASSFYQATTQKNYPKITVEAANSFSEEAPVFLNLFISFDQKSFKRLGLSAETNDVESINFDIPEIIDSVRSKAVDVELVSTPPVEVPPVAEVTEEVTAPEPATEEPVEVVAARPIEEDGEQPSNWWLWLIGVVIVVGSAFVLRSRK